MALALATVALAYLLGSVPFGVVFARLRGVDLREHGSGNIGATNAARVMGKAAGLLVLLCDAAKGFLPVLAARLWLEPRLPHGDWWTAAIGAAAFVGHLAPPWLRFRGGKGVATALGVFLALSPVATGIAVGAFVVVLAIARVVAVSSLAAATVFVPALWWRAGRPAELALAALMWVLIVLRHRGNIARLLGQAEKKG